MMVHSTMIIRFYCVVSVLVPLTYDGFADAFCTVGPISKASCQKLPPNAVRSFGQASSLTNVGPISGDNYRNSRYGKTKMFLVSEEDVFEAVERAETLWAEALEARKTANALAEKAEEDAQASAASSEKAANIFQDKTKPVTMEDLVQVDSASKASLDATTLVNEALKASDHARYGTAKMIHDKIITRLCKITLE